MTPPYSVSQPEDAINGPRSHLFFAYLNSIGFTPRHIRTDYRFETLDQIQQVVIPLFGQEMLERLVRIEAGWVLPECTGLWWRALPV
jgi:hypothetical protein